MITSEELQQIFNLTKEFNQEAATLQNETNAKNMREIVEKQTGATQQILDNLIQQLEKATQLATQNERKKILTYKRDTSRLIILSKSTAIMSTEFAIKKMANMCNTSDHFWMVLQPFGTMQMLTTTWPTTLMR